MMFLENGTSAVRVAAATGRRITRLLRARRAGWPGAARAAGICAAVAVLVTSYGGVAGDQAIAAPRAPVTSVSQATSPTWHAENSDTGHRLYDVACLSALRCEAVGSAGTIVSTANGGKTWRQQANPLRGSAQSLYQIACVAPESCYAIARPDTILVTHNGGASWSRHVLPVGVSGVSGTALTDQACLAAYPPDMTGRNALCRLGLVDITCVSARVCYAVSNTPQAYDATPVSGKPHAQPSSIWLTSDAGAKWTRQSIPPGAACNGDCGTGLFPYPLEWVTCLSSGLCRAGGGQFLECGHCGFAYAVLATHGPGKPWACTTSEATCGFAPDVATCPTSGRCYGVDSTNPFSVSDNTVLASTDGGANWQQIGSPWSASVLNDISCPTSLTCYLAGTHGSIARITNGTAVAAQHSPASANLYGIDCTGPATCYAVGDNGTILALH